jgi:hypothetical protein
MDIHPELEVINVPHGMENDIDNLWEKKEYEYK